mmetsp:Transcript_100811/g.289207  ORF Transcript_100811/g.289207 Transcript_100811/m.289207 type:complete len:983 (-) Transcript_100811:1481-4429(-)
MIIGIRLYTSSGRSALSAHYMQYRQATHATHADVARASVLPLRRTSTSNANPNPPTSGPSKEEVNTNWLEPREILTKPMAAELNVRTVNVRIETLSEWELSVCMVVLWLGCWLPYAIVQRTIAGGDDDIVVPGNNPCDGDFDTDENGHLESSCFTQATARFIISCVLVLLLVSWAVVVWRHWRWRPLWLEHSIVVLFVVGQIMLEDPYSAYMVMANKEYRYMSNVGNLTFAQPWGCSLMTFAILLLVDKCRRVSADIHPCKVLWLMISSMWAVLFYFSDEIFDNFSSKILRFGLIENKSDWREATIAFGCMVCAISMWETFEAWRSLRSRSYMKYRYLNLLYRLLLLPSTVQVVIVLFSTIFVTLYITTCFLPLFLMLAHLPPGPLNLVPVVRWRGYDTALLAAAGAGSNGAEYAQGSDGRRSGKGGHAASDRGRDGAGAGAEEQDLMEKDSLGRLRTLEEGATLHNAASGGNAHYSSRSNVDRGSSNLDPAPSNRSTASGSSGRWSDGVQSWSSVVSQRIVSGANEIVHDVGDVGRNVVHGIGTGVTGLMETITTPMMGIAGVSRHTALKPTFCLETSLWAVNLSNLVYWDIPTAEEGTDASASLASLPSGGLATAVTAGGFELHANVNGHATRRPSDASQGIRSRATTASSAADGSRSRNGTAITESSSGVMCTSDLEGLARNGMRILAQIDDDETDTHVVVIGDASTIWIGFRGTASQRMVKSDLDTIQVPITLSNTVGGSRNRNRGQHRDRGREDGSPGVGGSGKLMAHLHRGFWMAYAAVQVELHRTLRREIRRRRQQSARAGGERPEGGGTRFGSGPGEYGSIVCVGHSLGGALASICALDIACCQAYDACLVCPTEEGVWTHAAKEGDVPAGASEAAGKALEAAIMAHDDDSEDEGKADDEVDGSVERKLGRGLQGEDRKAKDGPSGDRTNGPSNQTSADRDEDEFRKLSSFRRLGGQLMLIESVSHGRPLKAHQ